MAVSIFFATNISVRSSGDSFLRKTPQSTSNAPPLTLFKHTTFSINTGWRTTKGSGIPSFFQGPVSDFLCKCSVDNPAQRGEVCFGGFFSDADYLLCIPDSSKSPSPPGRRGLREDKKRESHPLKKSVQRAARIAGREKRKSSSRPSVISLRLHVMWWLLVVVGVGVCLRMCALCKGNSSGPGARHSME